MNLAGDILTLELLGREPWPSEACLYQAREDNGMLLPDLADSLAVRTFLRICGLPFTTVMCTNSEYMSPSGQGTFIELNKFLVSGFQHIVVATAAKGKSLSEQLTETEKADMKAYMSLVTHTLTSIELYLTWANSETFHAITKSSYGAPYTWPLNYVLPVKKRWQVQHTLKSTGWAQRSLNQVLTELDTVCQSLSDRLADRPFYFHRPTELDSLVYGHISALCMVRQFDRRVGDIVRKHSNLIGLCDRLNSVQHSGDS